jgi:hypothetical protein
MSRSMTQEKGNIRLQCRDGRSKPEMQAEWGMWRNLFCGASCWAQSQDANGFRVPSYRLVPGNEAITQWMIPCGAGPFWILFALAVKADVEAGLQAYMCRMEDRGRRSAGGAV